MRPSAKPVGLPDLGCSASQLKKLHFFAKPEGFKYFNIENRIANKCVSGNQVNPEEGSCPDSLNSSYLSKKATWGQVDRKERATECTSDRKPREEPGSGGPPCARHSTVHIRVEPGSGVPAPTVCLPQNPRTHISKSYSLRGQRCVGAEPSTLPWDRPRLKKRKAG